MTAHNAPAQMAAVSPTPADAAGGLTQGRFLSTLSFSAQRGPVTINAKTLEFDYRAHQLTFRGEVMVVQDDMTLQSNALRVVIDERAQERVREIVADGAVRITKGERVATGGRATFDQANRTVVLSEGAALSDGPQHIAGETLTVYLDEERSVVEGGKGPVHMVLVPATPSAGGAAKSPTVADRGHAE